LLPSARFIYRWIVAEHRQKTWLGQLVLRPYAWLYALAYGVNQVIQKIFLSPVVPPVPVISVGNLSTGGTGKTPVVIALAKFLTGQGYKVVILSRGYGASQPLMYGQPQGPQHGDEPWLIQQSVPEATVIVGRNRSANALQACKDYRPDVLLLDDGFQHRKLHRQLDTVLVDASSLVNNRQLLPAGPYREPLNQLKRADWCWLTKGSKDDFEQARQIIQALPVNELSVEACPISPGNPEAAFADGDDYVSPPDWQQTSVTAVCGIARPHQFFDQLTEQGYLVAERIELADHATVTKADVEYWLSLGRAIITTEKDWVKIKPILAGMAQPTLSTLSNSVYPWWVIPYTPALPIAQLQGWCDEYLEKSR
jgi:tetraacyldisaccharide 4'-kinase